MHAQLCQTRLSSQSLLVNVPSRMLLHARKQLGQQLFDRGIPQFQVARSQCAKVFYENLANAEPDEFRFDRREHGVMAVGPSPFLQNCNLLGLTLQILENSREKNTDEIFKRKVLLKVGRIREFTMHAINGFVVDCLMKESARFVATEVVRDTADDLFQVIQKTRVISEVFAIHGATCSRRSGSELHRGDRDIDEFFPAGPSQVSGQPWVVSQIFQKAFCK